MQQFLPASTPRKLSSDRPQRRGQLGLWCALALFSAACEVDVEPSDTEPDSGSLDAGGGPTPARGDGGASDAGLVADAMPGASDGSTLPGTTASQDAATPRDGGTASQDSGTADAAVPAKDGGTALTGRMAGMLEEHNRVRAAVDTTPGLMPLVWSEAAAAYAQEWADHWIGQCDMLFGGAAINPHRTQQMLAAVGYGENIAMFGGTSFGGNTTTLEVSNATKAANGWAAEKECWTYGTLNGGRTAGTEKCDYACYHDKLNSDGCGHYTAMVWRSTTSVGCGVGSCVKSDGLHVDFWVCNYAPAGNYVGKAPY
jgi:pathogenesis-related protein 1